MNAVYDLVVEYISSLEVYGEVRATRKVSTISGICLRDKEDNSIYLPMNMSIRNCYSTYLDGIGYEVKNFGDGNYRVKWKGESKKSTICIADDFLLHLKA